MAYNIYDGFSMSFAAPIDYRMVTLNSATRAGMSASVLYDGLKVFQRDTRVTYIYNSNTLTWDVEGAGSVSGNGLTNYLAKFSGTLSVGTSSVYNLSQAVGINTNVIPGSNTYLQIGGTGDPYVGGNTGKPLVFYKGNDFVIGYNWYYTGSDNPFTGTVGSSKITFNNIGDLSIGNRPVSGSFTNTVTFRPNYTVFNDFTIGATTRSAMIRSQGNNIYSTSLLPDYTWYNDNQTGIFNPGGVIGFSTGGVERMRINSIGNVFIGTPFNPNASNGKLIVVGTTNVKLAISSTWVPGVAPTTVQSSIYIQLGSYESTLNSYRLIGFGRSDGLNYAPPAWLGYQETDIGGQSMGDLIFGTKDTNAYTIPIERLRIKAGGDISTNSGFIIKSTGNVGIGNINPVAKLDMGSGLVGTNNIGWSSGGGSNFINIWGGNGTSFLNLGYGVMGRALGTDNVASSVVNVVNRSMMKISSTGISFLSKVTPSTIPIGTVIPMVTDMFISNSGVITMSPGGTQSVSISNGNITLLDNLGTGNLIGVSGNDLIGGAGRMLKIKAGSANQSGGPALGGSVVIGAGWGFGADGGDVSLIAGHTYGVNPFAVLPTGVINIIGSEVTIRTYSAKVQVGWFVFSDRSLKTDIKQSDLGLDFITKLNPVSYIRKSDTLKKKEYGFIAQEVDDVLKTDPNNGIVNVDEDGIYSIRYTDLIAPLVKSIQDQQRQIEELKEEIKKLK